MDEFDMEMEEYDQDDRYGAMADAYQAQEEQWGRAPGRVEPEDRRSAPTGVGYEYGIPTNVREAAVRAFRDDAMLGYRDAASAVSGSAARRGMATSGQVRAQQRRLRGRMVDRPTSMYRTQLDLESERMAASQRHSERMMNRQMEAQETAAMWGAGGSFLGLIAASLLKMSDARLKTNVRKSAGQYDSLGLQTYEWDWNDKAKTLFSMEGKSSGVMAQDVETRYPQAVSSIRGYLAVDYGKLDEILAARGTHG